MGGISKKSAIRFCPKKTGQNADRDKKGDKHEDEDKNKEEEEEEEKGETTTGRYDRVYSKNNFGHARSKYCIEECNKAAIGFASVCKCQS